MNRTPFILYLLLLLALPQTGCRSQGNEDTHVLSVHESHVLRLTDSAHHYTAQGDTEHALAVHREALVIARKHGLREHEARSLMHIAKLLPEEESDSSLGYLGEALSIAKEVGHAKLQSDIYYAMASVHKQQQNYKDAMAALEAHHVLADSLMQKDKERALALERATADTRRERVLGTGLAAILLTGGLTAFLFLRRTRRLNKELQASIDIKNRLFSIIGHDLRGPANTLAQSLTLFGSGLFTREEETQLISELQQRSLSLTETLDNLLRWSKAQLQGVTTVRVAVQPTVLVASNVELLSGLLQAKQLTVHNHVPGDLAVSADKDQLDFILRNLLSNAIKFSKIGSVITVEGRQDVKSVILSVSDEGVGMTAEQIMQIEAGAIMPTYGTNGEKGSGLGLLLVKEFMAAHGGIVRVESMIGKGTVFYVHFPVA